ncbi:MAG TPA: hypothetical protein VFL14_11490 [Xanthomonadales bacterium]|nr:hypothetical protein [Xanthomonadales bacterium]
MRTLPALLLIAALPAGARHCEIGGVEVNPDNGSTTAGRTGTLVCRDDDGKPLYEHELRDGEHIGMEKSWGFDGSRTERTVNANGNSDGMVREFWPDGMPKTEGEYRDGDAVGLHRRWHRNGKIASISFIEAGSRRHGARIEWDDTGALKDFSCAAKSMLTEDRQLCGWGTMAEVDLHARGRVVERRRMLEGRVIGQQLLDESGRVVQSMDVTEKGRIEKRFHPDGKQAWEKVVVGDWVTSEREWYMNGAPKWTKTVDPADERNPLVVTEQFRDDGTLREREAVRGRERVHRELFDANGQRSEEFLYAEDGTERVHRKFAADGSLRLEEELYPDGSRKRSGPEATTIGGA